MHFQFYKESYYPGLFFFYRCPPARPLASPPSLPRPRRPLRPQPRPRPRPHPRRPWLCPHRSCMSSVRSGRLSQKNSSVPMIRGTLGLQTFSLESAQTLAPRRCAPPHRCKFSTLQGFGIPAFEVQGWSGLELAGLKASRV